MRVRALLVVALLATGMPALASQAAVLDVTCIGTETVTYQPGLLLTPQTVNVTVKGTLTPCTGVTSGSYLQSFTATLSCATVLAGLAATRVFHWNDGTSSTFSYERRINNAGGQTTVTFVGTITAGRFAGSSAVQQVVFVTPNTLQCLAAPGLTNLGPGAAVLTIT